MGEVVRQPLVEHRLTIESCGDIPQLFMVETEEAGLVGATFGQVRLQVKVQARPDGDRQVERDLILSTSLQDAFSKFQIISQSCEQVAFE